VVVRFFVSGAPGPAGRHRSPAGLRRASADATRRWKADQVWTATKKTPIIVAASWIGGWIYISRRWAVIHNNPYASVIESCHSVATGFPATVVLLICLDRPRHSACRSKKSLESIQVCILDRKRSFEWLLVNRSYRAWKE
jgi:hypothetical protein